MTELDINEIFQPSSAIRTNHRDLFVGRERKIAEALAGLASDGASLCVLGERGVGKTSLTWRVKEFLSGDRQWLQTRVSIPFKVPSYDIIWLEVLPSHRNVVGIVADLVSDRGRSERFSEFSIANDLSHFIYNVGGDRLTQLLDSAIMKSFADELRTTKKDAAIAPNSISQLSDVDAALLVSTFRQAADRIAEKRKRQILIILDEIDRLPDKTGIGDLIKTGNSVRFCIVGVADNVGELVLTSITSDHPSAERKLFPVMVERLQPKEISEFFNAANSKLAEHRIILDDRFTARVTDYSEGFPYLLHRMSRDALLRAMQDNMVRSPQVAEGFLTVAETHFDHALEGLLNPRSDGGQRYDRLSKIDNSGKESFLFALAQAAGGWVDEGQIATAAEKSYGLAGNLTELEHDKIVVRGMDPDGGRIVRFSDPITRAIVKRFYEKKRRLYKKKQNRN